MSINRIFRILALIAAVALLSQVVLSLRYTGKNCCGIVGNKIQTWAPVSAVLLCNGFPNERSVSTVSNERFYTYNNVRLFDRNASIEYIIAAGRVAEIKATITEDAEEIYPLACDKIRETYEDWDGFTVQKSKDGCKMDNHIGPPWIFADIAVQNNILTIDITEQR